MKKGAFSRYGVVIVIFVVCLACVAVVTVGLWARLAQVSGQLGVCAQDVARSKELMTTKDAELQSIRQQYDVLEAQCEDVSLQLDETKRRLGESLAAESSTSLTLSRIKTEIDVYKAELQESIQWLRTQSNTYAVKDFTTSRMNVTKVLLRNCEDRNGCEIRTACMNVMMSKMLGLEYRPDIETTDTEDHLQSIQDFVDNRGGDCEDYAFAYKAMFNTLLLACDEDDVEVRAWVPSVVETSRVLVSEDPEQKWYLSGASEYVVPSGYRYPSVVCGLMYDLNTFSQDGHCVIALTNVRVADVHDLAWLEGAPLIEPQNGMFMGFIGSDSGIYLGGHVSGSYINQVMTDDDRYLYGSDGWNSYSSFIKRIDEVE